MARREDACGDGTGGQGEEGENEKRLPKRCCTHTARDGSWCGGTAARICGHEGCVSDAV